MSFTSLTPIQIQHSNRTQNQPLTLKQGQVLHGTVKKLYPDQIAEVQVGGHKFLAKLETPLKAGDSHFLQVTSISPQTELKVVTGPMNASDSMKQQIQQLLDSMNLPKTANMMQLAAHFIKEQVPISKEQFQLAQKLLNMDHSFSKKEVILALQKMIELNLPLTKEVFQAVLHGSKTSGMTQTLESFAQQLMKEQTIANNTKTAILENLEKISRPLDTIKGGYVLSKAIQSLFNESEPIGNKLYALNLMKEASIVPKEATLTNWSQTISNQSKQTIPNQILLNAGNVVQAIQNMNEKSTPNVIQQVKVWIQDELNLSPTQKSELLSLISRFENMPKTTENIQQFTTQMNSLLLNAYSSNNSNQLISNGSSALSQLLSLINRNEMSTESKLLSNIVKVVSESTHPKIQSLNDTVEQQIKATLDGNTVQQAIKSVLKSLGVSYEIALNSSIEEIEQISNQLKPNLLSLLKEGAISPQLKDATEALLGRMNGMQLLSGENGHQHQIVMQIPLQFFGKSMDATLQWNAKMNDNGKIDSDYARILFYLDMESLKETVVDMQVQNRIVTITLFNENNNLQTIAEAYQNLLKDRLSEKGYYLSGIFFKTLGKTDIKTTVNDNREVKVDAKEFNGVDIRI